MNIPKEDQQNNNHRKIWTGVVVSDKSDKTIVVKVEKVKIHPVYKKRFSVSKKYKVHDETNQYKVGNKVRFIETKPISKDKKWVVI